MEIGGKRGGRRRRFIPAEEANVHLGGHWVLAFPKRVFWFMSRREGEPFSEAQPRFGTLYRTGNADDMIENQRSGGLGDVRGYGLGRRGRISSPVRDVGLELEGADSDTG